MADAFGGPRQKLRRQMEKQKVPKAQIEKVLLDTFGPEPKGFYDGIVKKKASKESI